MQSLFLLTEHLHIAAADCIPVGLKPSQLQNHCPKQTLVTRAFLIQHWRKDDVAVVSASDFINAYCSRHTHPNIQHLFFWHSYSWDIWSITFTEATEDKRTLNQGLAASNAATPPFLVTTVYEMEIQSSLMFSIRCQRPRLEQDV